MANRNIVSRTGKGSKLTTANHDQNLNALASTTETQTSATYEVVYTDHNKLIELNHATMVCTLDAVADIAAAMDSNMDDFTVTLKNLNTAVATINASASDTIDGAASITLSMNECVMLQTNAADDGWTIKNPKTQLLKMKSANESVSSSTTPQADNDLTFTNITQGMWAFEMYLYVGSAAGAGLKWEFTTSGLNANSSYIHQVVGNTGVIDADISTLSQTISSTATSSAFAVHMVGYLYTSSGTNEISFEWAQETSDATATTVYAGSWMKLTHKNA